MEIKKYTFIAYILSPTFFLVGISISIPNVLLRHIVGSAFIGLVLGFFYWIIIKNFSFVYKKEMLYSQIIPSLLLLSPLNIFSSGLYFMSVTCLFGGATLFSMLKNTNEKRIGKSLYILSSLLICLYFYGGVDIFSPDSWSYYELSKTIFSNFYHVNTIRQYAYLSDYGCSFPPLLPVLMAIFSFFTGMNVYSGVFINLFVVLITGFLCYKLSLKMYGDIIIGGIVYFFIVTNVYYIDEVMSGRSIPLSMLFMLILLYLCWDIPHLSFKQCFTAGSVIALGVLTRYDFLPLAGTAVFTMLLFLRNNKYKKTLLIIFISLLIISPWMFYSYTTFKTPFASDNGRTAMSVELIRPSTYLTNDELLHTLMTHPYDWIKLYITNNLYGLMYSIGVSFFVSNTLTIFLCSVFLLIVLNRGKWRGCLKCNKKIMICVCVSVGAFMIQFFFIAMTGFKDDRYFCAFSTIIILFSIGALLKSNILKNVSRRKLFTCFTIFLLLFFAVSLKYVNRNILAKSIYTREYLKPIIDNECLHISKQNQKLYNILKSDVYNPRVFFITRDGDVSPFKFGAQTGIFTAYISQPTEDRILDLLETFIKPTHIYCENKDKKWLIVIKKEYHVKKTSDSYDIYRVIKIE